MANTVQIIENLVQKLGSSSQSTVKKALAAVAKLTKKSNEANLFREKGGLHKLIELLKKPNNSIIDMAMSAIANCSVFEGSKKEIRRIDGILPIVSVLKNLKTISIQNRAARALANLAEDEQNAMIIEELLAIEELVKLLNETADAECQQSVLRGLKIMCTTQERKNIVYEHGAIKTMVELLKDKKQALPNCAIKTICELTKNCSKGIAEQIQEFEGIKEIIKLTDSNKTSVCSAAVMTVVNLCVHAHVRVSIGSEGGIGVLYKHAKANLLNQLTLKALEGLCYCCREAVNRNKVYECGGIELLLKKLSSPEHLSLHRKIITAFNCFYYNDKCLELLLNGGIVAALLKYLRKVIATSHNTVHCEEGNDRSAQESFTSDFSSPSQSPRSSIQYSILDNTSDISQNETFLEEAANLAIQVRDATESNRALTFKRKPRTRLLSSSSPTAKTIDQSSALFSFSLLESKTETTSMMSTCTVSSTSVTSCSTFLHSFPGGLICSTPTKENGNISNVTQPHLPKAVDFPCVCTTAVYSVAMVSVAPKESLTVAEIHNTDGSPCDISPANISSVAKTISSEEESFPRSVDVSFSPPVTPIKDGQSVPLHSPGHSALILLSRFSHMSDQSGLPYLLTKPCMSVLLDYLCLLDRPSHKCVRLLNHLTLDPQCFESLVCMGLACDVHRQLCLGYTERYYVDQEIDKDEQVYEKEESFVITEDEQESIQLYIPHRSVMRCQSIGKQLLDNLASQGQTPFGKGVLMHLLAKGSGEDLLGCVLTLPLLCRSKNLRQQMLVNKNGLKMLCDLLVTSCSEKYFAAAVCSLTALSTEIELSLNIKTEASSSMQKAQGQEEETSRDGQSEVNQEQIKTKRQKLDLLSSSCQVGEPILEECKDSVCKYSNNQYGSFDVQFKVDNGQIIAAHRSILSKQSDMFAAMLSSNFKEGSTLVVPLQEITADILLCVIHHAYGCAFPLLQGKTDANKVCSHVQTVIDLLNEQTLFDFLIEILAVADRFLMAGLKEYSEQALPSVINQSNITSLCLCAAHYHSDPLCDFGLKFLLLNIQDLQIQHKVFREIFKSKESSKLANNLHKLFLRQLGSNR